MKLQLPSVTLICVDCRNVDDGIKAMRRCTDQVDFGAVKMLTHMTTDYEYKIEIQNISTLVMYSVFMLKEIYKYVDTEHMLIVQRDGWILNPNSWRLKWFDLDYIGAVFNQEDKVGNGGFSFRSKRLMKSVSDKCPAWDGTLDDANRVQKEVGLYEDGVISMSLRRQLENEGFVYGTLYDAGRFSQGGNENLNYYDPYPFGFHGSWRAFDQHTGFVQPKVKHNGFIPEPLI